MKPQVRVVRILVYEGDEEFIKASLGEQRHVKGKISHGNGTITEGYLSGDVGNMTFVEPEVEPPRAGLRRVGSLSEAYEKFFAGDWEPEGTVTGRVSSTEPQPGGNPRHPLIGRQVTMKVDRVVETSLTDLERSHQHDCYKDGDENIPQVICDSNGQVVLSLCKKCGKAEVELIDTICPGDYKKLPRLP